MPGGGGPQEPRPRRVPAANAASKAAKRAHLAAALAVQLAAPPRPRSLYFARNRNGGLPALARRRARGQQRRDGRGAEDGGGRGGGDAGDMGDKEPTKGEEPGDGNAARRRSEDSSSSSVSRSRMSSSDYSTEDESSEYLSEDDDDDDDDDEEEDEEDAHKGRPGAPAAAAPKASGPSKSDPARRAVAPPRMGAVAAALEAVAAARARLRQPKHVSSAAVSSAAPTAGTFSGTGAGTGPEPSRLPPVAPRSKRISDSAAPAAVATIAASHDGSKLPETGTAGLSALRLLLMATAAPPPPPLPPAAAASTASRRTDPLANGPSGKGFSGASAAVHGAVGPGGGGTSGVSAGLAAAGVGDKGESLTEWVAQRFRSSSRLALQPTPADAAAAAPGLLPRSLPGSGGSASSGPSLGGEGCNGLRGLLAARSDGAASWYARPVRWHDPLSPVGASHTSALSLDSRPPGHVSAASPVPGAVAALAPLDHPRKLDGLAAREAG